MLFKNCCEDITSSKVKAVDSPLVDVETVTHKPRNRPFVGASIDRSTPATQSLFFEGMIVTNIDYTEAPTPTRPKRVTFKSSTLGGYDGKRMKAVFIKNVKVLYFLFDIDGFNNEPDYTLEQVKEAQKKMKKLGDEHNIIVPVIWPSEGSFAWYNEDRTDNAPEAAEELGMAFGSILKTTNKFEKKNLLCHSMGNYVLRKAAGKVQGVQFDNIIMVAADLRHNLFDKRFIDSGNKDGLYILRLLKQKNGQPLGKIYIVYNGQDYALEQSSYTGLNWVTRMGTVGVGTYDSWGPGWSDNVNLLHPEIRGHTENYDAGTELRWTANFKAHSYQWMDFMLSFYKSKLD